MRPSVLRPVCSELIPVMFFTWEKKKKEEEKETILAADSQYSFSVSYIGFLVLKAGSSVLIFD